MAKKEKRTDSPLPEVEEKPLLWGKERSKQDEFFEKQGESIVKPFYDASSVPGHAEIVMANEVEGSHAFSQREKESYYKRFGQKPRDLPADFRWIRISGPDGRRSYNADVTRMKYLRDGYRAATKEDLDELGFSMPVTAEVTADGTIRREDTALFIIDGERARQLEAEKHARAAEMDDAPGEHDRAEEVWLAEEERRREDPIERELQRRKQAASL